MCAAFRPRFRRRDADDVAGDGSADEASDVPGDEADGGDDDEWLAYELHEWSLESRVMLQQLLTVDQVVHSWQGTTLLVHESLEDQVDRLIDEAEEAEKAKEATSRPIGPDDDLTAFEVGDWSPEMRAQLVERLVQARVPHILEESAAAGDEAEGDGAEGDGAEGDGAEGDGAEGDGADGAVTAEGDAAEGDAAEGDAAEGDEAEGEGDAAEGDAAEGDAAEGDAAEGDAAEGDEAEGDAAEGDAAEGDAAEGDAAEGDGAEGDAAEGDAAEGDAAEGDAAEGDEAEGDAAERDGAGGWDLWVRETDEERVDLIVDDMLASVEEAGMEELDGLEVNDLLSGLFVACDRLRRDPRDLDGRRGVLANARRLAGVRTPFGFAATSWRSLRGTAGELLALVEAGDTEEEDLRELAHRLGDSLRMLI